MIESLSSKSEDPSLGPLGLVPSAWGEVPEVRELKSLINRAIELTARIAPRMELVRRNTEITRLSLVERVPKTEIARRFELYPSQVTQIVDRWRQRVEPVIRCWLNLPARKPVRRQAKPARQTSRSRRRQFRQ